jgi:hypothetical protein
VLLPPRGRPRDTPATQGWDPLIEAWGNEQTLAAGVRAQDLVKPQVIAGHRLLIEHCHVPENDHWDPGYTATEVRCSPLSRQEFGYSKL